MKYVSLDLETTGLDPINDQVLQLAMVVEDTDKKVPIERLPYFECFVFHKRIEGTAFALSLNRNILEVLADERNHNKKGYELFGREIQVYSSSDYEYVAQGWLRKQMVNQEVYPQYIVAGKNVATFDLKFFKTHLKDCWHRRTIDPGSVFIDWKQDLPLSQSQLCKKFGVENKCEHDALYDARTVIELLRHSYYE
jgi:oligoribonuclease